MSLSIRALDELAPPPRDVLMRFACDGAEQLFHAAAFERSGSYVAFRSEASRAGWKVTDLNVVLGPCCSKKAVEGDDG